MNPSRIILPPQQAVDIPQFRGSSLLFLCGPIQSAPPYHDEVCGFTHDYNPQQWIASPKALSKPQNQAQKQFQITWELQHQMLAAQHGVIMFWLAKENIAEHDCERAYAQTTRVELGRWLSRKYFYPAIQLVIGIEPGFSGETYLRALVEYDLPGLPIYGCLEHTCIAANQLLQH